MPKCFVKLSPTETSVSLLPSFDTAHSLDCFSTQLRFIRWQQNDNFGSMTDHFFVTYLPTYTWFVLRRNFVTGDSLPCSQDVLIINQRLIAHASIYTHSLSFSQTNSHIILSQKREREASVWFSFSLLLFVATLTLAWEWCRGWERNTEREKERE